MIIKRWNGTAFVEDYPKTTVGMIVASGTPSSTTYLRGDGTWNTPTNTTYSEITESEINDGSAATLRSISGRRVGYIMNNILVRKLTADSESNSNTLTFQARSSSTDFTRSLQVLANGTLQFNGNNIYHAGNTNIGTGSTNYKAGNYTPTKAEVEAVLTGAITSHTHSYEPTITAGTTGQYWRGDKTWQTLPAAPIRVVGYSASSHNHSATTWSSAIITTAAVPESGTYRMKFLTTYTTAETTTGIGVGFTSSSSSATIDGSIQYMTGTTTFASRRLVTLPTTAGGGTDSSFLATTGGGATKLPIQADGVVWLPSGATMSMHIRSEISLSNVTIQPYATLILEKIT
jgi:hypothetical protein